MNLQKIIKRKWFLFALVFFVALIGVFEMAYSNRYYPGVMIAGESVGGKTYDEVSQELKTKSDELLKNGLSLVFETENGKKEIHIPIAITGLTSDTLVEYFYIGDLKETASDAYDWGHKGTVMQRIKEQLTLLSGKNFNSPVSPHKVAIQSLLARETKDFFKTEVPAQFSFDKNNNVIIIPEKSGDNLDTEKVVNIILQKFDTFQVEPIVFKVQKETPYTTKEKLTPFINLATEFAKTANINFYYQNHKWHVSGKTIVTWLTLNPNNEMTVDTTKLDTFLSKSVVPLINDPPQNSRFEMKNGKLVEIYPGKSGDVVNVAKTIELIQKVIPQMQEAFINTGSFTAALIGSTSKVQFNPKDNIINIPIETIKVEAEITQKTIDKYNIKDLVGTAQTNFAGGSLDRQHNIEVGVSKLTGILIAPGQEFSTAESIGDVTEEAGFVKEYVIKGDQTIKELGGGLCQLATTLFRTALNAGLPITERVNHAYVIPYYGPGLDATIYGPHPDFRFVNDTGNYLLLQGKAKNNEVTFELYGVADGRIAQVSTPVLSDEKPVPETRNILSMDLPIGQTKCTTITHKGITADATYTVRYADGSTKETIFHSVYEPWPEVCLIGASPDLPTTTNTQ